MFKYKINCGYSRAYFYTPLTDSKEVIKQFCQLASQCFGIRKSISIHPYIMYAIEEELPEPAQKLYGAYEMISYNGNEIVWDKDGNKIKFECDYWEDL